MNENKIFPTGGIYIGVKNEGDANTNEILYKALEAAGFSADPDPVKKEYNGKPISVFLVTFDFVQMFYAKEKDFKLKFVVYRENNYGMQRYELLDPNVKKKAKRNRYMKHRKLQGSRKICNKMRD